MKPIGVYRKCDFVTMTGTTFALSGILLAVNNKITFAVFCLIFAAICDAFDGVVARKHENTKEQELYGVELDSLSDAISFGVLPMLICLNLSTKSIYVYIISVFFVLCGIIRLAYFNMLSATKQSDGKGFVGLPITTSAMIVPLIYFITFLIGKDLRYIIMPLTLLITGIFFIMPFKLKKPTNREKLILSIFGVLAVIVILLKMYL